MSGPGPTPVARVLLPFAGGYVLSYAFRSVNAIIAPDLAQQFALSPSQLGLLTSAYFLSFAAFQIPLGLLLDRFGPRRTDAALLVVAACGALIFALSFELIALLLGRALIGLGVSGCLMSAIKANVLWFAPARLPVMNGWMFFAGGVGLLAATMPVELALKLTDWRGLFLALAALTLAAAGAIAWIVPERQASAPPEPLAHQLDGLRRVLRARSFWQIAAPAMFSQSTMMAIQGLWAGPWLRDVAGLSRDGVAAYLLLMAVASMAGALLWGQCAVWLGRRGVPGGVVLAAGLAAFIAVQVPFVLAPTGVPPGLWIGFGLLSTAGSLAYAVLPHRFGFALAGRANTALNALVFTWAFLAQWAIGVIIGLWPVTQGHYHPDGYRAAFAVFLALQAAGFAWMLAERRRVRAPG